MTNTVINPDFRIVETIARLATFHGKHYCFPSQDTLLRLLKRFTGRAMSRRSLNRHLNALKRDLYIITTRRHTRKRDGSLLLRSTLYTVTLRFAQRAGRLVRAAQLWRDLALPFVRPSAVTLTAQNYRI